MSKKLPISSPATSDPFAAYLQQFAPHMANLFQARAQRASGVSPNNRAMGKTEQPAWDKIFNKGHDQDPRQPKGIVAAPVAPAPTAPKSYGTGSSTGDPTPFTRNTNNYGAGAGMDQNLAYAGQRGSISAMAPSQVAALATGTPPVASSVPAANGAVSGAAPSPTAATTPPPPINPLFQVPSLTNLPPTEFPTFPRRGEPFAFLPKNFTFSSGAAPKAAPAAGTKPPTPYGFAPEEQREMIGGVGAAFKDLFFGKNGRFGVKGLRDVTLVN